MKRVLALILSILMLVSLAACGSSATTVAPTAAPDSQTTSAPQETTTEAPAEPVTIKVANYALLEKGYEEFWTKTKADFEAKYPHITIEWVTAPYGEILNQVINMAGGGDKVDAMFGEMIWIPTMADSGLAAPIADVLDQDFINDYYPNVLAAHEFDGEVFAAPLYVSSSILFYNKDLFTQAGLDPNAPPKTYDEMLTYAEKLSKLKTKDGNPVFAFGQPTASVPVVGASLTSAVANFGGSLFDAQGNLDANNNGFKDAMAMIKLLDDKGYNPQNSKPKDLRNLFALGQLAMYYDQAWGFNGVKSINPDAVNFTATAMPLAGGSGTGETTLQSHCFFVMDNGDARKDAAKKFVQYVITPEVLNDYMANITPAYPARKSMAQVPEGVNTMILSGAADSTSKAVETPLFASQNNFNLELCTLAQGITVGDKAVETAIADFEKAAKGVLGQ